MTEEEITKALECCARGNSCEDKCPFYDAHSEEDLLNAMADCTARLSDCALNLINSQKAEIERLRKIADNLRVANGEAYSSGFEIGKIMAIKEFAERLKRSISFLELPNVVVRGHIDNLVKEMTEGCKQE